VKGPRGRDARGEDLPAGLLVGSCQHRRTAADGRGARLPALAGRSPVRRAANGEMVTQAGGRQGPVRGVSSGRQWPISSRAASRCSASTRAP
jgi:hypothetical protein